MAFLASMIMPSYAKREIFKFSSPFFTELVDSPGNSIRGFEKKFSVKHLHSDEKY
jgi:hypothetical protein